MFLKPTKFPVWLIAWLVTWLVTLLTTPGQCQLLSSDRQLKDDDSKEVWRLGERLLTSQISVKPAIADLDGDGNPELLVGYSDIGWLAERPRHLYSYNNPEFVELAKSRGMTRGSDQATNLLIFSGVAGDSRWDWSRARWLADDTRLAALPGG